MIVRIGNGGHSFKGMDQYFGHDKGATTKERVAWTHTLNMLTDDPDKAWKVMAYTTMEQSRLKMASGQKSTGKKLQKPVFAYALAWHPEHELTEDHIRETALKSLETLGMTEYQVILYRHRDEPQPHVHIIVNRVHPETGLAAHLSKTKERLSDFARMYEREHGKIYCKQREENFQKRKEGEKTRYADPNLVKAWNEAADGKAFIEALKKEGYHLAQGRKRVVVVDKYGKIFNPTRQLPGIKAKDLKEKLKGLNLRALFDAASLSGQIQTKERKKYEERQKELVKKAAPAQVPPEPVKVLPTPEAINRLQNRHLDERAKHFNHYETLMESEQKRLNEHYKVGERQNAIKAMREKTANPSWWRKIRGLAKQDLLELRDMKRNYRNVQERIKNQMDFWTKERERTATAMHNRHDNEKYWLYEKAAEVKDMTPIPNPAKVKARDLDHDK